MHLIHPSGTLRWSVSIHNVLMDDISVNLKNKEMKFHPLNKNAFDSAVPKSKTTNLAFVSSTLAHRKLSNTGFTSDLFKQLITFI